MIRQNIIANMVSRVFGVVSVYLFIPLYLRFLGAEAYGLVGFFATLSGVITFADMGLTATLNREMARLSVCKDSTRDQVDLLRTYELVYVWISFVIASGIWFLAPLIANHWLKSSALICREITLAIRLMGFSIALQFLANLYVGGLMGLQRQTLANSLQIGWSMARGVGAILVLWLISPTVISFFCWQLISNVVCCFSFRAAIWRAVSNCFVKAKFKWFVLRNTWRYAVGMVGQTLFATILIQTDKLAVSKLVSLEMFGYYMLAVALAGVPRMLASPISVAVFPRFTGLVETGDKNGLTVLYHKTAALLAIVVIPAGLTLAMFSGDFLFAWTGNIFVAQRVGLACAFLLVGEVLQAITAPAYYVSLAHGNIRLALNVQIASVIVITPLLIFLIMKYGVVGAGISWLVMNICVFFPYMYFVHLRFLPGELWRWLLESVGSPLLIAFACALLGRWLVPQTDSRVITLGLIALVWCCVTAVTITIFPEFRGICIRYIAGFFGRQYGTE